MRHTSDVVLGLIQRIYDAVGKPDGWRAFLAELARVTGAGPGAMFVGGPGTMGEEQDDRQLNMDVLVDMTPSYALKLRELYPRSPYIKAVSAIKTGWCSRLSDLFAYFSEEEYEDNTSPR